MVKGKPEAFCKVCQVHLRAHLTDLVTHAATRKHKGNASKFQRSTQPTLHNYGCTSVTDQAKIADMKLAVFIASHTSIQSIDHLGEILKELGKGSALQNIRIHRTKCSKIISAVVAPAFLTELVKDIGNSKYSCIVDECTDNSVSKFMGVAVSYFSLKKKRMITDFLGLVQVTECSGKTLALAFKEYLSKIQLPLSNLRAIGTDGASNMCGTNESFYTNLKKDVPDLEVYKCVCHSIDKCAEYAFSCMPSVITDILKESYNWFAYSAKRWDEYKQFYQTMNPGKTPKKLMSLSKTRWLVWLPVSDLILEQWYELRGFFEMKGTQRDGEKALAISKLYQDSSNMLYLLFLKKTLIGVNKVNKAFESTEADVTKLYSDLRSEVLALCARILKPNCMVQLSRPGMLRSDEARYLKEALSKPENLLPADRLPLGDAFAKAAQSEKVPIDKLNSVRHKCGEYIFTLCKYLLDKLPRNLDAVSKLRYLTPRMVLAKSARPTFQQLPTELAGSRDLDVLEDQWHKLGNHALSDVCPDVIDMSAEEAEKIDAAVFWAGVLDMKDAVGDPMYKDLALFALEVLTVPVSNAVVERVFSVLGCIKTRRRNKLQLEMLESLIRLRIHLKVDGLCCKQFKHSEDMINRFTSKMYLALNEGEFDPARPSASRSCSFRENSFDAAEAEDDPDEPDSDDLGAVPAEEQEEDFRIVSMIDATRFDETLLDTF
ncbi:Protein ZBED8 [Frankliniella fusca]|uniref:Protein ZBED8 n=1 Tax=Frankliniella fusca TaxID=407009 RepID=A0AAE1H4P9_9NEOP|nr:Protein ZBED8 [Frankliniella fusca]